MNLKRSIKLLLPHYQKLILDYPIDMKPRWGEGKPPHAELYKLIDAKRRDYEQRIQSMLDHRAVFYGIRPSNEDPNEPAWNNRFLPGLDIVALYTFVSSCQPKTYLEIGSGNSTKVVRKCIRDHSLSTRVVSIDPVPRANIDHLADEVIRLPLEKATDSADLARRLEPGDILFIDNSHRSLPNSDVTVCFLELIPRLKPGVVVHIHDIHLPYDYPQELCDRFYSEQYLLAVLLLANPTRYQVLFPATFVSVDPDLSRQLKPLWQSENTQGVESHGNSFWLQIGD